MCGIEVRGHDYVIVRRAGNKLADGVAAGDYTLTHIDQLHAEGLLPVFSDHRLNRLGLPHAVSQILSDRTHRRAGKGYSIARRGPTLDIKTHLGQIAQMHRSQENRGLSK